jgi:hypothetical protein
VDLPFFLADAIHMPCLALKPLVMSSEVETSLGKLRDFSALFGMTK